MPDQILPISAVVCTRNRGASVAATIETILDNSHPAFEVILVDQSTNDETEDSIVRFLSDPRLHYIRSETKGLGRARNIGMALAKGEVVAFTDDDCTVPTNWLEIIAEAFNVHQRISVVFSTVTAGEHDPKAGFIPDYIRQGNVLIRTFWEKRMAQGIGAGMAVRRKAILDLGGFDEMLGAGARFPAGEDWDIVARVLTHGQWVYETDAVSVVHYGFRSWSEGRDLVKRDWLGIGATYAKLLKCRQWSGMVVILYEVIVVALLEPLTKLLHLRKPDGLRRIVHFIQGVIEGLRVPINRQRMCYISPEEQAVLALSTK